MKFRKLYESMFGVHKYSSVQLNFNSQISSSVLQFGNIVIPDGYLYYDKDGDCGRENQIHCTVLYGIESKSPNEVKIALKEVKEFEVELGQISFFEKDDCDVMKIEVHSDYLKNVNSILRNKVDYQNDYPNFIPHCTVAYLKKDVKEYLKYDVNHFVGLKQTVTDLEFSSKDGSREYIRL